MLHREIECQNKTVDTSTIYKSKGAGLNDVPKVFFGHLFKYLTTNRLQLALCLPICCFCS